MGKLAEGVPEILHESLDEGARSRFASYDRMPGHDGWLGRQLGRHQAEAARNHAGGPIIATPMPLATGARVGPYEIVALIGAGGMGEVYRARDAKLNRDVAIKVLPQLFTADPDRLARFHREAQVLASLNHQNIGHIYGFEDSGTTHALVLELVEGPTLADRIGQGAVPLEEALPIARQIADALECAHEQGIIHRDLKPANIKIRPDGTVKVLDFGLAKAFDPSSSSGGEVMNSPTLTARATQLGTLIGTAAYMAPEQARGRAADRRADIWAFGVVLYEMLSGKRAFEGDDISITLASVLKEDPKWSELPANLPTSVRRMLRRCLEKDPRRRLGTIGDARLELEDVAEEPVADRVQPLAVRPRWRRALPWTIAILALATTLVSVALWAPWRREVARPAVRITADIGIEGTLAVNIGAAAVISPDGETAVFVAQTGGRSVLYVRPLAGMHSTLLKGTEEGFAPFFSPDSQWIGFFTPGKLKKIAVTGGATVTLCDAPNGRGGSWGKDGTIVFQPSITRQAILHQVSDAGGAPTPIGQRTAGELSQRWPQILPGGKAVLYSSNATGIGWDSGRLMVQPLEGGDPRVVVRGGYHGRYVRSGHLLYMRDENLFSVPFDPERLELLGRPVPIVDGVLASPTTGGAQFSISDIGTLLYVPGKSLPTELPVMWMEQTGKTSTLRAEPADWSHPSFSPDGHKLAMTIGVGPASDIWIYEWARDTITKFTFGSGVDSDPVWTADGRRIAFASRGEKDLETNLYWKWADGTGEAQRLTESPHAQIPVSFHPSGRYLAFTERKPDTSVDIMILPLEGGEKTGWKAGRPTVFFPTRGNESGPMFSPDGRWLAYLSTESGMPEIYVRPFAGGEGKWKISTAGGFFPSWSRTRRELFYLEPSAQAPIMVAAYKAGEGSFHAEKPQRWSPGMVLMSSAARPYDLHPDGLRVAMLKPPDTSLPQEKPVFIFNVFDELRRVVK
jgi:serine/threonine-protein kinase